MKTHTSLITPLLLSLLLFQGNVEAEETGRVFKFVNADVTEVLEAYNAMTGTSLIIASNVTNIAPKITLQFEGPTLAAEAAKKVQHALLEQAGVILTHLADKRVSVTYNDALMRSKRLRRLAMKETGSAPITVASGGVSAPRVVFAGPTSLEGWTRGKMGRPNTVTEDWSYTNGALVATTVGSIARDVRLPAVASVDFDLVWSNALQFSVALYADSLQPLRLDRRKLTSKEIPPFGGFYSLQLNGNMAYLLAVDGHGDLNSLGKALVVGLRDKTAAHVTIRIHKPDRRLYLYIDNNLIKQWDDGQNTLGSGTCLRFVNQGLNRLEISRLVVSEWDGQTNAPSLTRPGSR